MFLYASVQSGKIVWYAPQSLQYCIQELEGQQVQVIIEKRKNTRTDRQNRYLWGAVYDIISSHTGHSAAEVHDAMKMMFLRKQGALETLRSTAKLSTAEFTEYIEKIRYWAANYLNVNIPLPDYPYDEPP